MLHLLFVPFAFSFACLLSSSAFAVDYTTPTERKSYTESENGSTYTNVSRFVAPTNSRPTPQPPVVSDEIQEKVAGANKNPLQAQDIKQLGSAISFAKSALLENTELAKQEFGMSPPSKQNIAPQKQVVMEETVKFNQSYNTPQYRDIFYSMQDSALVNQAIDYFSQGKKMIVKPRRFVIEKVQVAVKPVIHVSSIMYNDPSYWVIFTNIGKFSYTKPVIDGVKITESSSNTVEFMIPAKGDIMEEIKKHGKKSVARNVSIQKGFVAVTLRTGECFFAKDLEIATKCAPRIQEIEKQIEI